MMLLAPGRLSMTTACLVFSSICLPIRRAVMSPDPPGPNGTMILIGRDGYWAAWTTEGVSAAPISARTERRSITLAPCEPVFRLKLASMTRLRQIGDGGSRWRSRRSAAKLLLFLLAEFRLCRRSVLMPRLSRVGLLASIPPFGIVMRLLVKRRLVRGLCVFAVRLRRPFLLANSLARGILARRIFHRLDADIVFLVGTTDLDGEGFRGTAGDLEFGGGVHDADGADIGLVDTAAAADHRQQPARFRILPAADGGAEPD